MNKLILTGLVFALSGCYVPQQSIVKPVKVINFNFKIKDVQTLSRVKSIDAYLVKDINNPLGSNVYSDGFKYQADIVNGVINITFSNYPEGGPYFLALQTFDDIVSAPTRKNITAIDSSVNSGDNQVARSINSVSYTAGSLSYSDNSSSLNILINLSPYNNLPVNLTPQNGNNNPTNAVFVG